MRLLHGNQRLVDGAWQRMRVWRVETSLGEHGGILVKSVGVPFWCRGEHDEAEARGLRRCDAIGVRHKLDNGDFPARAQSRVCFLKETDAIGWESRHCRVCAE